MAPLLMAALNALGHAIFWFVLAVFDLVIMAYGGPEWVVESIQKIPKRAKAAREWICEHPIAFIADVIASAAFAGFWWYSLSSPPGNQPPWFNAIITLSIFGAALIWFPIMIGWIVQHPVLTGFFVLVVVASGTSLYFFSMPDWLRNSLILLLVLAGSIPLLAPMFFGTILPVICGVFLAIGYAFRLLVTWLGLHGIAKLLESTALVSLGLAEYFKFYGFEKFNLTEGQYGQLVYFGAFAGALSVGFTVLSLLSEKTRAWLGDRKLQT